ncbi:MAG: hypothetical protein ACE5F4_01025 [Candidatus Paceibacteria bacterium]
MNTQHASLAEGRWHALSLAEQLANIGSEVHRARIAQEKGLESRFHSAADRALELFDLTLADLRWKAQKRLFELGRMRAVLADAFLGGEEYGATLDGLEPYFDRFALLAAQKVGL